MSATDRLTLILRPAEGSSLEKIAPFAEAGMSVAVGRSLAVVDAKIDGNLALHAQEMFDLLRRINVKVGGYDAVLDHGGAPSYLMYQERNQALSAIWDLLDKIQSGAPADEAGSASQGTEFDIDAHAKMVVEAERYRLLRSLVASPDHCRALGAILPEHSDLDDLVEDLRQQVEPEQLEKSDSTEVEHQEFHPCGQ